MEKPVRLQKFLAMAGVASRRKAEEYIAAGRVKVDGKTVTARGVKVTPDKQIVLFDNRQITVEESSIYILLNKPKGYVTTLSDPQGRPIVTSLLPGVKERVFPVGRLDLDTEGALILTNDGALAQSIQHPSNEVHKTYQAEIKGHPDKKSLQRLEKGIRIEGKQTAPARIRRRKRKKNSSIIEITIHEGRKRQVKIMFNAIGHPVLHLKRLAYGSLTLDGLPLGKYKILSKNELKNIFSNKLLYKQKNS